ncbi:NADH-ubiquinone oxidoreductase-F iron-sulfur binding region domain-containing protein [Haladaptatus sp. DJG-WS-42]|uniref:NADH-ubiquinone oxidoreductase-F iron-sulfur binding region domain-containing protein n=1 Tax=Haladaptatus sp. DJG-WS-42 TaxID=3120516 RepID=UPI0030CFDAA5
MADTQGAVGHTATVRLCGDDTAVRDRLMSVATEAATDTPVVTVGSTGIPDIEPLVALSRGGVTDFLAHPDEATLSDVISAFEDGTLAADHADFSVTHEETQWTFPAPDVGPLAVGIRRALARCGWVVPDAPTDYDAFAYEHAREAGDDATARLRRLSLLGRGRGDGRTDQPITKAWDTARESAGDPVVVVNANESDPRNQTDRTLLCGAPIDSIDAALAVAELVGEDAPADVVCYLNEADELAQKRVRDAVAALEAEFSLSNPPEIVVGPDRFIAGEMTMALEAMEGKDRLEARLRPPTPDVFGLYGRPTVIHTPRTLAQVREAILSPDRFDAGSADPGTRLVTVTGGDSTATVELATDDSLSAVQEAVTFEGALKLACVGGQFGGLTRTLDVSANAPTLLDTNLGTDGAVELFGAHTCPVALAGTRSRFAAEENCGRCVPCREGSTQLVTLLRNVYDGEYDNGKIRELARVMRETSTCDFGQLASRPVTTAMAAFEHEFIEHAAGRCPTGVCEEV